MKKPVRRPRVKPAPQASPSQEESERSLRLMHFVIQHTSDAVLCVDGNGRIRYANPAACLHLGYDREELLLRDIWDIDPAFPPKTRAQLVWDKLKVGEAMHLETAHRAKDGRLLPAEVTINRVMFEGEELNISFCRDVSARQRAEAARRISEELLSLFVENAPAPMAMLDRQMRYLRYSRRWLKAYHLGERDITGLSHYEVLPEIPERWKEIHRRCLAGASESCDSDEFVRADGSTQWLRWEIRPWYARPGEVGGILIFSEDITERKRAEAELAFSERKFSAAFKATPHAMLISELESGRIIDPNEAFVAWTGFTREEALGRTTKELELWPEPAQRDRMVALAKTAGPFTFFPARLRLRNGDIRDVFFSGSVFTAESRSFLMNEAQDVTDILRTQRELVFSEKKFVSAFDSSSDPMTLADADTGRIVDVNRAFESILGFSRQDAIGRDPKELNSWVDPTQRDRLVDMLKAEGQVRGFSADIRTKTGELRTLLFSARIIEVDGRRYILNQGRDVTDALRSEQELRLSHSLLAATLESTADGILAVDREGRVTSCNQRFLQMFNIPEALAEEKEDARLLDHARSRVTEPEAFLARVRELHAHPEEESSDTLRLKDGRIIARYSQPQRLDGKVVGRVWSFRDVTQRVWAERELGRLLESERKARAEAETANKAKDDFLAIISHELRTPLTAILGWSWLLRSGNLSDQERRNALDIIMRNMQNQRKIVEDLIDVSILTRGQLSLNHDPVELNAVLGSVCDSLAQLAHSRAIRLSRGLSGPVGVLGDAGRLQQVFLNLLHNSLKFTPDGGEIRVSLRQEDGQAIAEVTDSGKGIAADFLPHVFEPFRQGEDPLIREHHGLGLGLAIVKRLVEFHGGTVSAASPGQGRGAVFTVRLPLAACPPPVQAAAEAPATMETTSLAGLKVLVVEDEADARQLLQQLLSHYGALVATAADAAEAWASLEDSVPDLLLCDIALPGEDGCALIRKVRGRGGRLGSVPAAALTAMAREEDRTRALQAGFQAYLTKPMEPLRILEALRALAGRR